MNSYEGRIVIDIDVEAPNHEEAARIVEAYTDILRNLTGGRPIPPIINTEEVKLKERPRVSKRDGR